MEMNLKNLFYLMLLTIMLPGIARSQSNTQYTNFGQFVQDPNVGARNAGLANANIAEYHDITSMYENPATIAFLGSPSIVFNHLQGSVRQTQENLAFPILYGQNQMLAFSAQVFNFGELVQSNTRGWRFGMEYDLAYAHKVTSTLSLGGLAAFQRGVVSGYNQVTAASYDIGLDYVPSGGFSYGLTFSNLGTGVNFPNGETLAVQTALPRTIGIGATMRFPSTESILNPFLIISMATEKTFNPAQNFYRGAIEYIPVSFLSLRFGYVAGAGYNEPTFGIGLHTFPVALDVALYEVREVGSTQPILQVSLSTELW